jgi:bacillithiol synthase
MESTATHLPYSKTGYFSSIVTDYINGNEKLRPFYNQLPNTGGIKAVMDERKQFNTNRALLVSLFEGQYKNSPVTPKQQLHLQQLSNSNTFTVCTAHQPNIFSGQLYFIYKILHAIKLAENLKTSFPENDFVPVYYMGSEDADLDELGYIFIDGQKYEWKTKQTGAVGRMKVDKALVQLIHLFSGQISVLPYGNEIISLMKDCYKEGVTIEQATFQLVNNLFAGYGLLILLPDNPKLKAAFIPVIERELTEGFSHKAVKDTTAAFPAEYKAQASGREINLFYLLDGARERIEIVNGQYAINNTALQFSKEEILIELQQHPERFSPNVILRPVLQEIILPNIAFIGGGGEIAYWLELKKVFAAVGVPYPLLIVRNSFLLIENKYKLLTDKLAFSINDLFKPALELINSLVKRDSAVQLSLQNELNELNELYNRIKSIAGSIDNTLQQHTAALQTMATEKISALEKKMLRAEKRKFEAQQRQLQLLKSALFPNNSLQERTENFMLFYAKWGKGFIESLYKNSLGLEQEFTVLVEK